MFLNIYQMVLLCCLRLLILFVCLLDSWNIEVFLDLEISLIRLEHIAVSKCTVWRKKLSELLQLSLPIAQSPYKTPSLGSRTYLLYGMKTAHYPNVFWFPCLCNGLGQRPRVRPPVCRQFPALNWAEVLMSISLTGLEERTNQASWAPAGESSPSYESSRVRWPSA